MSGLRQNRYWLARRTLQVGTLALFWLGAHRHLPVLTGNLSSARLFDSVPLSDPYAVAQILATLHLPAASALTGALLVLLFYTAVGGRAFCGWVCPLNIVTDTAAWLKRHFGLRAQFRVDRSTRHWIMVLALVVSAVTGVAAFERLSPIGMTHRELIFAPGVGLLGVLAIFLLDLFVVRLGWCGSLCPLGAFYSWVGRRSLVRIRFDSERCDRCGDCVAVCPEPHVIDFNAMSDRGFIDSGDCLNCARCLEVCPPEAFHPGLRFSRSAAPGHS